MSTNILLLCGGDGSEHDISLLSAKFIKEQLEKTADFKVVQAIIHNHQFLVDENITGFFGMMTDCSIDYPEVILQYDVSKNTKTISGPTLVSPSEYVYIHIIASAAPKTVTVLSTENNTILSDYIIQTSTITGFNEYIYKFNCSEDRSKANNILVSIETTNASDKIYGYYIVG